MNKPEFSIKNKRFFLHSKSLSREEKISTSFKNKITSFNSQVSASIIDSKTIEILDPIQRFLTEINKMIFIHFHGKELLEKSTVSWNWNEYIGTSRKSMKNLKLLISSSRNKTFTDAEKDSLIKHD
jgi:hypothetical protein